ncbi:T9SS type A sorting domain-containing protein [Lewinella sp. JB7]|uniref:T9SS type A sorting domain-containing protein n=1 Tax=Lewinella sp. JB7 TaxID=2962887 RepID=UPI0020C9F81B|nr:T9SS type A sorting domain-containing protein [Lewinella sp. JB7]MCP9235249.1 T9SS type A sorting domain-containing protein [Lewinella sp. JB7]
MKTLLLRTCLLATLTLLAYALDLSAYPAADTDPPEYSQSRMPAGPYLPGAPLLKEWAAATGTTLPAEEVAATVAGVTVKSTRNESDYYMRFHIRDITNTVPCNLGQTKIWLEGWGGKYTYTGIPGGVSYGSLLYEMPLSDTLIRNGFSNFGSYDTIVGPDMSLSIFPRIKYVCVGGYFEGHALGTTTRPIYADAADANITIGTSPLRAPMDLQATDAIDDDTIRLTWTKGTDFPDNLHQYYIYRDGQRVDTLSGTARSYVDAVGLGQTHTYEVSTSVSAYGGKESSRSRDKGSTFSIDLKATDGTKYNATNLSWNNISSASDEIRIERSLPDSSGREEIAIVSSSAKGYNVTDGIPGVQYLFYVTPVGSGFLTDSDLGYSRPDGRVSGHVKSSLGAGVGGVEMTLTLLDSLPAGGRTLPAGCAATYCTTTDIEGYYEFKDVYYHELAEFTVKPSKGGTVVHEFSPATASRTLSMNNKNAERVDFTDLTVFTAKGRITYPAALNGPACGVPGVTVLIDSIDQGIRTKRDGSWSYAIQQEGTYTFTPKFIHHRIETAAGLPEVTLEVDGDRPGLDFIDRETDTLKVYVQNSCGEPLGSSATLQIYAANNCYDITRQTDSNGVLEIILPAREYSVKVTAITDAELSGSEIMAQIGKKDQKIDLTVRDTSEVVRILEDTVYIEEQTETLANGSTIIIQAADTIPAGTRDTIRAEVRPELSFIYRSPLDISIDYDLSGVDTYTCDQEPIAVMEQGLAYTLTIDIREVLGTDCALDTGYLNIYDFVSDRGDEVARVPIRDGIATYTVEAGEPNIAVSADHNHEKLLYVIPDVDLVPKEGVEFWFLVTGAKIITPSFITRSPEIPMLVLHDPPGDNSYAYVEKGQSFSNFNTLEVKTGGSAGAFANLVGGASFKTPFSSAKFGLFADIKVEAGKDNQDRKGLTTTLTFNEKFSTSQLDNLTGHAGDVYIGAALNQEFSDAQHLTFDNCQIEIKEYPTISAIDFATTFVYTENHIKNSLLPTLGRLRQSILHIQADRELTEEEIYEANHLLRDSISWVNILAKNNMSRGEEAILVENISFSAGAPIYREESFDTVAEVSYEFAEFVKTDFALGLEVDNETGSWHKTKIGIMGSFRWSSTNNTGSTDERTRTVGYVLDDGDIGDFFSVDILRDKNYNVPAFNLKVGTTSCPQEPGTQARDRPEMVIFPPELNDVPRDGLANLVARISNRSESRETREYAVRVVSTTNPDGALIRLGGQIINNSPAHFFIPYNQTIDLNLSVARGPLASNYQDIQLMVYPPCEYDLWQDNGNLMNADTFGFTVNFQTECSDIALRNIHDGWIVNSNSNDLLPLTLSGYDLDNEEFEYVEVQIKRDGEGYTTAMRLEKAQLAAIGANYDLLLDMSRYSDGAFQVRAAAFCGVNGHTYSSEKRGIIDRKSLAPYGIPTPNDGFLRPGQEISVAFDKNIDCNFDLYTPVVTLRRADTDEVIAVTTQCADRRLILQTTPHLTDRDDLQGVRIHATVDGLRDLNGNVQKYATEWNFLVNVKPVFWDPAPIYASGMEGRSHVVQGVLKNNSNLSKAFSLNEDDNALIHYPEWLTPQQQRGTLLPNGSYVLHFDVDPELTPGIYRDSIVALVDDKPVTTAVTFELLAQIINWSFDPTDYDNDMTVVAQFSLDGTNNLLSADSRDRIGAFVNGQIRGIAQIEYVEETRTYAAFLRVYSNEDGSGKGEEVTFRFWRALTGAEYGAKETLPFTSDAHHGSAVAPIILHPEGRFQVIPLRKGWNWISLNVAGDDMSREHLLQSLLNSTSGNDIMIKSTEQTSGYSAGSGWNGNLRQLELGQGYLLHLSNAPDTLKVVGLPSPDPLSVAVKSGWNWIGYPRLFPEPVSQVLSSLNARNQDIIKSETEFAIFEGSAGSWAGSLRQFMPGEGYKLRATGKGTIHHPAQKSLDYTVEPSLYEYNMNVTGTFDAAALGEDAVDDLRVVALVSGTPRGLTELIYCPSIGAYRAFLLVAGNLDDAGQSIEFRVTNEKTGAEYLANGEETTFALDDIVGSVAEPYLFFLSTTDVTDLEARGYGLGLNVPNPASDATVVPFSLPVAERVRLELIDVNGRSLRLITDAHYPAGDHRVEADLTDLPAGVYMYRMTAGNYERSRRMVVR